MHDARPLCHYATTTAARHAIAKAVGRAIP